MVSATTIVTCVENGPLEAQVLMLAESLRAFGGPLSNTDFIAVKPRRGPGISLHTRREFARLGVEFIDERMNIELDWWSNANKSSVMARLEVPDLTPNITWMDGDMIVLQPFDRLVPAPGTNFIARAGEGYLGSDGKDDNAAYWRKLCELVGIAFDDFPTIHSFPERRPIRAYWQSGVYTYPTAAQLGKTHYEFISKLLNGNIGSRVAGIYHQDQVSISLAVQKLGLVHSEFDPCMNYNLSPLAKDKADILPVRDVKILHYHNALSPQALAWAMNYIKQLPADRVELIRKYVPFASSATLPARVHKRLLRVVRQRRVKRFKERVISY